MTTEMIPSAPIRSEEQMTDTLKPAELGLEGLKKVALAATPGEREAWSSIYEGMTAAIVIPSCDPLKTIAEVRSHYDDAVFLATFDPPTVLSLLTRMEALEAERDEARAGLAYVLDRAVYGDSYGVYGSDFQCCHFCQGGGAPGVAMEHDADCPVSRYPRAVADWFEEMEAERQDREAAEAQRDRMREALERLLPAAKLLQANSEGCAVNHYGEDFGLHGMPGFLIDTAKDIEAAAALSQGSGEEG